MAMSRRRAVLAAALAGAAGRGAWAQPEPGGFAVSYTAGVTDPAGHFMGGTELRCLAAHGARLFAGNGYWEDMPGLEGRQGAQILRLDSSGGRWLFDHAFDALLRPGRPRHLAVSALTEIVLRTDGHGVALPAARSLLLASTWDLTGTRSVFARDDATGGWSATALAQDRPRPGFLPQIRAIAGHRDRRTGADLVFAGDSAGIFAAGYDSGASVLRWGDAPELPLAGLASDQFPGLAGRLRISSFAEADGRLFAAIGQQVWVRQDGAAPQWHLLATNPMPFHSQTGLRGLTAIADPGRAPALLAAVKGQLARIVRIDPGSGEMVSELALDGMLDRAWGTRVSYVIAAYNDMTRLARADGDHWLLGLEAFIPPGSPRPSRAGRDPWSGGGRLVTRARARRAVLAASGDDARGHPAEPGGGAGRLRLAVRR